MTQRTINSSSGNRSIINRVRGWAVGLVVLAAASTAGLWLVLAQSSPSNAAPAPSINAQSEPHVRPLVVATQPVSQAGPGALQQRFTGIVVARRTTRLAAKVLGRVEQLFVELGDRVAADQPLVRLDSDQLQAARDVVAANLAAADALLAELKHGPRPQELQQSQSRLQELQSLTDMQRAQQERTENLRGSAAISKQELDEARFQTDAVAAQLLAAQQAHQLLVEGTRSERIDAQRSVVDGLAAQLRNLDIQLVEKLVLAPYAGHIQARLVDEGAIVSAGQPLLEIVESGELEVHVGLPNEIAEQLSSVSLSVAVDESTNLGSKALAVSIARMAPTIQSTTRTREVVLHIETEDYAPLAIGSAVQVLYQGPVDAQGYWIPTAALTAGARGLWAVYVAVPSVSNQSTGTPVTGTPVTGTPVTLQLDSESSATAVTGTHVIERRQVELLRSQGEWSEVRGPLAADERLVIDGVHRIVVGQSVLLK